MKLWIREIVIGLLIATIAGLTHIWATLPGRVQTLEAQFASMDSKLDTIIGELRR